MIIFQIKMIPKRINGSKFHQCLLEGNNLFLDIISNKILFKIKKFIRKHLGCAVFKNYIYAVGGRDDISELNSAERYNPSTNQWQPVVSMKSKRSGVGLAGILCYFFYSPIIYYVNFYCLYQSNQW
jgi:hypothetical protein